MEPTTSAALEDAQWGPTRREVLRAAGVVAAAVAVTAACGSSGSGGAPDVAGTQVPAADVPVGGGDILRAQKVVVTQPSAGTFKAFSAVCTHQGCIVASVADGVIHCPCHGSEFSIVDGSVQAGPAPSPLPAVPLTVSNGTVTLG